MDSGKTSTYDFPQHKVSVATGSFDPNNVLQLSETRDVIEDFIMKYCGLKKIQTGDIFNTVRRTKPVFTYEFSEYLHNQISVAINRITGRTTFKEDEIRNFCFNLMMSMIDWFATEGMKNLISDKVWKHILDYSKKQKTKDGDGYVKGTDIWSKQHHIDWNYDGDVTLDMVNIIKENVPELVHEQFNQDIVLREILLSSMVFILGGLNRSKDGLTLNHEKVIYKEQYVGNFDNKTKSKEGLLDSARSLLTNATGG